MKNKFFALFLVVASVLFISISGIVSENRNVKISFVGDIIMHGPVKGSAYIRNKKDPVTKKSINNLGFDYLFEKVKPILNDSDITMGNLEFPILPPYSSRGFVFNCNPAILNSLKKTGFSMYTFANNHTLDQGIPGVLNTVNVLNERKIDFVGVDSSEELARLGVVKNIKGIKIGFLGYAGVSNYPIRNNKKKYFINWFYSKKDVLDDIRKMKLKSDYVILNVHTGVEYKFKPRKIDVKLMKEYLEAGVDLIIGHHPHVLQPVEYIKTKDGRDCYIFYSLGNFISNQSLSRVGKKGTQNSMVVQAYLEKEGNVIKSKFNILPIWNLNKYINRKKTVQVIPVKREIELLNSKLDLATKRDKRKIHREIKFLNKANKEIKDVVIGKRDIKGVTFVE